ncbi:MAG: hypothetical protein ER33_01095 [Cyanobium sp. CACIAM 14]|nr:MAG: hypothetical protein ER33_01095 [Cyanobium sp. CACIAM 14]
MILVHLGEEPFRFDRLLGWLELFLRRGFLAEELLVVGGDGQALPAQLRDHRAPAGAAFAPLAARARAVIADAGESTLQRLEDVETPFLLVPRSQRFGEQVDDHQVELALVLGDLGVPIAWGPGDLLRFLAAPRRAALADLSGGSARALCQALERRFPAPVPQVNSPERHQGRGERR